MSCCLFHELFSFLAKTRQWSRTCGYPAFELKIFYEESDGGKMFVYRLIDVDQS